MNESKNSQKKFFAPSIDSKPDDAKPESIFEIEDWMMTGRSSTKSRKASKANSRGEFQYRLGMYIRLSPSDEIREEGSLISHPQRIHDHVNYKNLQTPGWGVIVEKYEDKDVSGKDINRPAYLRMLADLKAGKINGVIVTELSRLNRNVKDFLQFWEFLKCYNGKFFSLKENFDTSTAVGEMMVIQSVAFAQFERNSIVERIRHGARARAERGLSNGSQRCLGYDIDPHRRNYLIVNEAERLVVKLIFEKFLELGTIEKARVWLNEKGYRTKEYISKRGEPHGGKPFTHASLYCLLTNKTYIGLREFNKANRSMVQEDLEPHERYRVSRAVWPALIKPDVFRAVQERLERNAKTMRKYRHVYLLSGKLICGECGSSLVGKSATGRNKVHFYYGHSRKFTNISDAHTKRCLLERVPAQEIEAAVASRLKHLAKNPKLIAQIVSDSQSSSGQKLPEREKLISVKKSELAATKSKIANLTDRIATLDKSYPSESLFDALRGLEVQKTEIQEGIKALEAEKDADNQMVDMDFVFQVLQIFNRGEFQKLPGSDQKMLIDSFVHRLTLGQNVVHAEYYGQTNEDLFGWGNAEFKSGKRKNDRVEGPRSGVLPSFKLVDLIGIEPTTSNMPC